MTTDEQVGQPVEQQAERVVGSGVPGRRGALSRRWAAARAGGEEGMSTAEYAVGTVAACAFAAVLYQVVTGGSVASALGELVQSALSTLS